jgi:hypothetical protein
MQISLEQREAWASREENRKWEAVIGPHYKRADGSADIDALHELARLNGIDNTRQKYADLNPGQVAMNVRNRLRPLWISGVFKLPSR